MSCHHRLPMREFDPATRERRLSHLEGNHNFCDIPRLAMMSFKLKMCLKTMKSFWPRWRIYGSLGSNFGAILDFKEFCA